MLTLSEGKEKPRSFKDFHTVSSNPKLEGPACREGGGTPGLLTHPLSTSFIYTATAPFSGITKSPDPWEFLAAYLPTQGGLGTSGSGGSTERTRELHSSLQSSVACL